ncbi:MAG: MarR family winged helix-turn-helix transcriptional regulator [Bacilli bacterium]
MADSKNVLNNILVELFNHILYLEEQNLNLSQSNLTMNEVHLMDEIAKGQQPTMGYLAKQLMITEGTLSTNFKRLEDKGYVYKQRSEIDGRIFNAYLKDKAIPILKDHEAFHTKMIDQVLDQLSGEEEVLLINTLVKIAKYFNHQSFK